MVYLIIWLIPILLIPLLIYLGMEKGQSLEEYVYNTVGDAGIFFAFLVLVPFINIIMTLMFAITILYNKLKHLRK